MPAIRHHPRRQRVRPTGLAPRRGVALVFVLMFVVAMAALAMGSIFMASNSNLLAKSYDKERDLRFAAEMALAMGKSRVNADPSILVMGPDTLDKAILLGQTLTGADNKTIPGITVNVYVGPTGSTSGQFGRFSSIVAEARDARGNGFIRRLELTQESFAKFAYWSNSETSNGSIIYFNNGDELWGPVWSNDNINIGSGGATFHDQVATAGVVNGKSYGTYAKGVLEKQPPIKLPSTTSLAKFQTLASTGGWSFTSADAASNDETQVRDRIEFLAVDLNQQNDSTDANEGFFRYYTASSSNEKYLRGDWPGSSSNAPSLSSVTLCGDFHWAPKDTVYATSGDGASHLKFYPAAMHGQTWFRDQIKQGYIDHYGWPAQTALDSANKEQSQSLKGILDNPGARCFLAGDPHLVATDRLATIKDPQTGANYVAAAINKGGTDTTFTPVGAYGSWKQWAAVPNDTIKKYRPWDGRYLIPIDRSFNSNARGVIFASGNVAVSGVVNGRITLYAKGTIVLLDDVRYANDPVKGVCHDILGMISDKDIVIADNALNDPPPVDPSSRTAKYYSLDDTKDFYLQAVMMALGNSFRVENYASGPTDTNDCYAVNNGRGCIFLAGGIIQQNRGAVGTSTGTGYTKRYSYDHCAVVNPPPYFPTTGRFVDNRYLELDPAGFNDHQYFKSLTPVP
jgi:hypothetical protein